MSAFNDPNYFRHSNDPAFHRTDWPGAFAPDLAFDRCETCGEEVACNARQPPPLQNHRQHHNALAPLLWGLIAVARQVA